MCLPCMSLGDSLELNKERLQERVKRLEACVVNSGVIRGL